jgi:hypothetical protein
MCYVRGEDVFYRMLGIYQWGITDHRRGYSRALWEGYLRALGEDGSDNLSSFNAKTIRRKIEARHGPDIRGCC